MNAEMKTLTDYLVNLGIEQIAHTGKSYLAHLIGVYRLMEAQGCEAELCRAGMFHSIYGTQQFQGFTLPLERRAELRGLIGERAERLAYLNCTMDRATLDHGLDQSDGPYSITDRLTGGTAELSRDDYDDLCRVHLYDWLEQAPRSRLGWGYRREAYRQMAERLGPSAQATYERVFALETTGSAAPSA